MPDPTFSIRLWILALFLGLAGCSSLERPTLYDFDRPVSVRTVDGVLVVGPYTPADLDAILSTIRAKTEDPILDIGPPSGRIQQFYRHKLDRLPSGEAMIRTGERCEGRCGSGHIYYLTKHEHGWVAEYWGLWLG